MKRRRIGYLGIVSLFLAGCGGSSSGAGSGSCGEPSGCGGDVTGSWKITSSCLQLELSMDDMSCAGITRKVSDVTVTGTATYNSDKTYQASLTVSALFEMNLPAACLTQQNVTLTCAQLQQSLQGDAAANGFESVSCTGSSGCVCSLKLTPQTASSSGTYSTSGGTITQTETGGTPDDSSYCVQGSTLTLSAGSADPSISGSIVFTKQ